MSDSLLAYTITVHGVVQGVGFRYYTKQKAIELSLLGSVENQSDGSVYIQVEGPSEPLMSFVTWCHQGPATARVEKLEYSPCPPQSFSSFEILR